MNIPQGLKATIFGSVGGSGKEMERRANLGWKKEDTWRDGWGEKSYGSLMDIQEKTVEGPRA